MKRLVLAITTLLILLAPATALAWDPLGSACSGKGSASTACTVGGSDPVSGHNGILMKASLVISSLAGVTAVIIILVSAFRYITSAGDTQKASSARSGIIGAVIGLAIIMAAEGILVFVLHNIQ
jgi:hypothetical protein